MNILLIEPDTQHGRIYSHAIARAGHTASVSQNAQLALAHIDKQKPALIILELNLGGNNGIEFLYELRSYSDLQDIPIIIHTMVPKVRFKIDSSAQQKLGIIEFLYKPDTTLSRLLTVIDRALIPTV